MTSSTSVSKAQYIRWILTPGPQISLYDKPFWDTRLSKIGNALNEPRITLTTYLSKVLCTCLHRTLTPGAQISLRFAQGATRTQFCNGQLWRMAKMAKASPNSPMRATATERKRQMFMIINCQRSLREKGQGGRKYFPTGYISWQAKDRRQRGIPSEEISKHYDKQSCGWRSAGVSE